MVRYMLVPVSPSGTGKTLMELMAWVLRSSQVRRGGEHLPQVFAGVGGGRAVRRFLRAGMARLSESALVNGNLPPCAAAC